MYGDDFYTRTLIAGDSGGSIFAVGMTLGCNTEQLYDMYLQICESTRQDGRIFYDPLQKKGASIHLAHQLKILLSDPEVCSSPFHSTRHRLESILFT